MTQAHTDILLQANAAVARGDHAGFLSYCTEDTTWNFVGQTTLRGKAAVRGWMDDAYRAAPPEVTVCRLISDGDMLTAVGEMVLTDAGGRRTHHAYCDVWRLVDFKLASLTAFVIDTDEPLSDLSGNYEAEHFHRRPCDRACARRQRGTARELGRAAMVNCATRQGGSA